MSRKQQNKSNQLEKLLSVWTYVQNIHKQANA